MALWGRFRAAQSSELREGLRRAHPPGPMLRILRLAFHARFLTTERVVDVVGGFLKRGEPANAAARYLIALAALEWKRQEGSYRDDITATVVFLGDLLPLL